MSEWMITPKSQEPKAKSQKPKAKSQKPKAKSQKPKAKSQKPKDYGNASVEITSFHRQAREQ
ncbi:MULTISPECIES: hypothetical protein [Serratia]|uniref:hypothetical protein n=1 Tax=Serratia TaxID=613 RepID=UPI0012B5B8ED|nr:MULTISPECIES: hypothetical protein [Serratia]